MSHYRSRKASHSSVEEWCLRRKSATLGDRLNGAGLREKRAAGITQVSTTGLSPAEDHLLTSGPRCKRRQGEVTWQANLSPIVWELAPLCHGPWWLCRIYICLKIRQVEGNPWIHPSISWILAEMPRMIFCHLKNDTKKKYWLYTERAVSCHPPSLWPPVSRTLLTLTMMMPVLGGWRKVFPSQVTSHSSSAIHRPSFTSGMSTCLVCVVFYKLNGHVNVGKTETLRKMTVDICWRHHSINLMSVTSSHFSGRLPSEWVALVLFII